MEDDAPRTMSSPTPNNQINSPTIEPTTELWEVYILTLVILLPVTILVVLGVFFAEWRDTEKDVLEQLTKLNQALAFLELRD